MSLVITRILSFLTIVTIGDSFTDSEDIWPSGLYSLPKPISGCPETTLWSEGWIKQDLEDTNHMSSFSPGFHMNATLTTEYINRTFCVKNIDYRIYQKSWPTGSYCIYQGTCSSGMVSGRINWDDEDINNENERGGTLPAGHFYQDTLLYYCCQNQGQWFNPIDLPTDKPFYLLPHGSRNCQRVKWALSSLEFIIYDTENVDNIDQFYGNHVFTNQVKSFPKIFYCYYVGCRYKLQNYHGFFSASSKNSPDYSYPDYQYCSWLITVNKTHVVSLSFLNISVPDCQENFIDIFDGVSCNKTQLLDRLCGQNATSGRTIISTGNNLYVVFKSGDNSKHPTLKLGFYAKYEAHHVQPATPTTTTSTLTTTLQSGTPSETEATATTNTETKAETETSTKIGGEISSTKQAFGGNTNFRNNSENKSTTVLPIVLPILAVLLVSLAIIFFWRRHKQKNNDGSPEVETRQNVFYDARINTVDTAMEAVSSRYEMPPWVSRPQESQTQDVAVVGRDSMNLIYESAGIVNNANTDQVYCSADNVVYEAGHDIAENYDPSSSIYNHPDEITTDLTYSTPTISSPSEVHKIPGLSASQSEPVQDGIYDYVE